MIIRVPLSSTEALGMVDCSDLSHSAQQRRALRRDRWARVPIGQQAPLARGAPLRNGHTGKLNKEDRGKLL